ncbi:MAG: TonB family protein [Bacteroidota bacterium]
MLSYILLMSVIQVVLFAYYLFILRKETWFRFNRFFLLGTLVLSFILPLTQWTFLPEVAFPSVHEVLDFTLEPVLITAQGRAARTPISLGQIAWNIYLTGMIASLGFFAYRLSGLVHHIRRLKVQEQTPFYTLYYTQGKLPTSSFLRYIFWDETQDLNSEERKQVLEHEYTHVHQGHSWDMIFLELVQIILWFHPMVYLIRQELVNVHEFYADCKATSSTLKSSYAQLILKEVIGAKIPLTHSFFESPALLRIRMLERMPNLERTLRKYLLGIPLIALLILFYRITPESLSVVGSQLYPRDTKTQIFTFTESEVEDILGYEGNRRFQKLRAQIVEAQFRLDSLRQIPKPWSQEIHKAIMFQNMQYGSIMQDLQAAEHKIKREKGLYLASSQDQEDKHSVIREIKSLQEIDPQKENLNKLLIFVNESNRIENLWHITGLDVEEKRATEMEKQLVIQEKEVLKDLKVRETQGLPTDSLWESLKHIRVLQQDVANTPKVNDFVEVDQEPRPLNLQEIRQQIGYPQSEQNEGIEGNVVLRILIDEEGAYIRHVVLNEGHPVLEQAVAEKIRHLVFSPATQKGNPVKFWVNIPFVFKLTQ